MHLGTNRSQDMMRVIPKQRTRSNPRNPQVHRRGFEKEHLMKLEEGGRTKILPVDVISDVYTRFCSCRQCWASKCRGL
jgi:hypothetical protein